MRLFKIFNVFKTILGQADHFDDRQAGELSDEALGKARDNRSAMALVWDELMTLVRLLKARATGAYRKTPWKSIVFAIAGVLYFVSPLDAVPDFIPLIGFADDVFVIGYVMKKIHEDVLAFRRWEGNSDTAVA